MFAVPRPPHLLSWLQPLVERLEVALTLAQQSDYGHPLDLEVYLDYCWYVEDRNCCWDELVVDMGFVDLAAGFDSAVD